MITLCMDTSHKHLVIALLEGNEIIAQEMMECFKQQSEMIFPELEKLCITFNIKPSDIGEVVITKGPGSYTGVRIAMTIAKVLCSTRNIPCYTLNTLLLMSGNHANCSVLLDARSKRAYFGQYDCGKIVGDLGVFTLDEIQARIGDSEVMGDGKLLGLENKYVDCVQSFIDCKPYWEKVENIHLLVPDYLKSSDEYLVK